MVKNMEKKFNKDGFTLVIHCFPPNERFERARVLLHSKNYFQQVALRDFLLTFIHQMQIWRTTRSAPGMSRMKARLVRF